MIDFSDNNKKINYTDEQQAIIDSKETSILVNSFAGTGKSSVLMGIAEKYKNGLYLAFNKAIVNDIIPKLPNGWTCSTFNAFGLRMIRNNFGKVGVNFFKYSEKGKLWKASVLAQKHMAMCGSKSNKSWAETCDRFFIDYKYIEDAKDILAKGQKDTKVISGDDMLQYPIVNGWKSDHYDIILVDEVQDLSPQQVIFLQCINADKIVFVGDRCQQIYSFRGSDPKVFDKIKEIYDPKEYEMTQSFRCPTIVLDEVNGIVPNIWSDIDGGKIEKKYGYSKIVHDLVDECMVLCRVNSELINLAKRLITNKINFSISDKFVKTLKSEISDASEGCSSLDEVMSNLTTKFNSKKITYSKNKWHPGALEAKYSTLFEIVRSVESIHDIEKFIKDLSFHADNPSGRKLMTIHSAKGLEHENVYFLRPQIIDSFKDEAMTSWQYEEEDNLYYVACTRSTKNLTFIM